MIVAELQHVIKDRNFGLAFLIRTVLLSDGDPSLLPDLTRLQCESVQDHVLEFAFDLVFGDELIPHLEQGSRHGDCVGTNVVSPNKQIQ